MKVCDHQNYKGVAVLEISGGWTVPYMEPFRGSTQLSIL